jgi:two-component system response regulator FixJ
MVLEVPLQLAASDPVPIYLVDDDPVVRDSIEFLIGTAGLCCRSFGDGAAFLAALPALADGCLLLDLVMPQVTGLDVMRQLVTAGRRMPIILMTAAATAPALRLAAELRPYVLIEKPFDDDALFGALNAAFVLLERGSPGGDAGRARKAVATLAADQTAVLRGIVAGLDTTTLARHLGLSELCVRRIRVTMQAQIGASDVYQLAAIARLADLLPYDPDTGRKGDT